MYYILYERLKIDSIEPVYCTVCILPTQLLTTRSSKDQHNG